MSESAQEKCKYCGRDLSSLEIYEICGCQGQTNHLLKTKTYTKLNCIENEKCQSSSETVHPKNKT